MGRREQLSGLQDTGRETAAHLHPCTLHTSTSHTTHYTPHTTAPQMAMIAGDVGQLHQIHSQYRSLWDRIRGNICELLYVSYASRGEESVDPTHMPRSSSFTGQSPH